MKKYGDYFLAFLTIIFIVISVLYHKELSIYLFPDNKDRVGELTKLLLSIIGGIGIFYGLIISNRRALITEKSVIKQGEQIELARKSQIDERFKNAVEHLGNDKEPIILGGVSELVQIAKEDSEKYSEVVFNILCGYIRSETNVFSKNAGEFSSTVIQTIINYLFKIDKKNPFIGLKADLSSSNLSGQYIDSCDFSGGDLSFTNWGNTTKSIFYDSSLDKAIISTSLFKDNLLNGAKLFQTYFSMVEFENKEFKSENSKEKNDSITSNFIYCKFINVSFDYRDLYQSNFICCIFQNCTFRNLDIIETKFLFSNLSDCDFSKVDILKTVDYRGSVFNNVIFNDFISDCIFRGCRIGQPETIFIIIDNYIESSFTSKTKINESFFSKTILNKCDFSEFAHSDANGIKKFLNELERDNISHRKQDKQDE